MCEAAASASLVCEPRSCADSHVWHACAAVRRPSRPKWLAAASGKRQLSAVRLTQPVKRAARRLACGCGLIQVSSSVPIGGEKYNSPTSFCTSRVLLAACFASFNSLRADTHQAALFTSGTMCPAFVYL